MSTKKIIISISVGVFILTIGGALKFGLIKLDRAEVEQNINFSIKQETQSREDIIKRFDFYNKAIATLDENLCSFVVGDDDMHTHCFEEIYIAEAAKELNISICDKIKNPKTIYYCRNNFFYNQALISKDSTACNNIFGDSGLMSICKLETTLGIKKETPSQDMIILASTMKTGDLNTCYSISTKKLQDKCINDIYFRQAISENKPLVCEKINILTQKEQCIHDIKMFINQEYN